MKKTEAKNLKRLLDYCERRDTYVMRKEKNTIYLQNGEILNSKKILEYV